MRPGTAVMLLASAMLAACATGASSEERGRSAEAAVAADKAASPSANGAPSPPAPVWEPWPPPERADVARPAASGDTIELACPAGGMRGTDLLALLARETGTVVSYDSGPMGKVHISRLVWTGNLRIPRSRLFDHCRALLSYQALILVPVGPREATGTWVVLDTANAMVKTRPTWIREEEVFAYEDCDGFYVITTLRVRDTVDPKYVRTAITPLATTTAGIGRVQDVPGTRHLIIGDFAPVVAVMKRVVDEINRMAEPPAPGQAARAGATPPALGPKK